MPRVISSVLILTWKSLSLNVYEGLIFKNHSCASVGEVRTFVLSISGSIIIHWSPSYADLRINLFVFDISWWSLSTRDDFNLGIKHRSADLKVPTLDIKIKHLRITIITQNLTFDYKPYLHLFVCSRIFQRLFVEDCVERGDERKQYPQIQIFKL